jgi:hypothetical protein
MPGRTLVAALLVTGLAATLASCGGGATPAPSPVPSAPVASRLPSPSAGSTVEASPSAEPNASSGPSAIPSTSQTQTEWGTIWDAVPADFPEAAGAQEAIADGPASLAYDVDGPADAVATELQGSMEVAGFSTLSLAGPLEDDGWTLDSVGDPLECLIRTTIVPMGAITRVTVLYGAACPAP